MVSDKPYDSELITETNRSSTRGCTSPCAFSVSLQYLPGSQSSIDKHSIDKHDSHHYTLKAVGICLVNFKLTALLTSNSISNPIYDQHELVDALE